MKLVISLLLLGSLFSACSSINTSKIYDCNENLKFKRKFFYNISVAEKYTKESNTITKQPAITVKSFFKALDFISKYSKVPIGHIYNYQVGYTSIEEFEVEKKKWLNWYDANKCRNIH
jgi:hypothetical protein